MVISKFTTDFFFGRLRDDEIKVRHHAYTLRTHPETTASTFACTYPGLGLARSHIGAHTRDYCSRAHARTLARTLD